MNYTKSYYITNIFVIDRFLSTEIPNFEEKNPLILGCEMISSSQQKK
jgi:hypothetical protein